MRKILYNLEAYVKFITIKITINHIQLFNTKQRLVNEKRNNRKTNLDNK